MILSNLPRLTIRRSLKNMITQIIEFYPRGDKTLISTNSLELTKYGWCVPCGNVPAAYLVGFLMGLKAQSMGIKHIIQDIGLMSASLGSRCFAVIKGILDSGLTIPCGDVLPKDTRIKGKHIASYAKNLAEANSELFERRFSKYLSKNLDPRQLPTHFDKVKLNIFRAFNKEEP